jgi:hypothetical protein
MAWMGNTIAPFEAPFQGPLSRPPFEAPFRGVNNIPPTIPMPFLRFHHSETVLRTGWYRIVKPSLFFWNDR